MNSLTRRVRHGHDLGSKFWYSVGLIGALLSSAVLADCIGSNTRKVAIDAPLLQRTIADYRMADGKVIRVALEGPTRITDRDGERRLAYPLVFADPSEPNPPQLVYYLDTSLHVVRSDLPCQKVQGVCQYYTVDWLSQGVLPRWGIGLLWFLHREPTIFYGTWNEPNSTTPQVKFVNDEILVSVADYWGRGSYVFRHGELFPLRFVHTWPSNRDSAEEGERTAYERIEPLAPADEWPKAVGFPEPLTRTGVMFPGEDRDDFGNGHPHREALDWLLNSSSEARSTLDRGGCVVRFMATPAPNPPDSLDPFQRDQMTFGVTIVGSDRKATDWTFERSDSKLGSSYSTPEGDRRDWTQTCDQANTSPWPKLSSTEFFELTKRIPVSQVERPWFIWGRGRASAAESGLDSYLMQYRPAFSAGGEGVASFTPYTVSISANHAWWWSMMIHPDDVKRMDAP